MATYNDDLKYGLLTQPTDNTFIDSINGTTNTDISSKLDTLAKTKNNKLQTLTTKTDNTFKKDTLLGMYDADTFRTEGLDSLRSRMSNNGYYDAVELVHGDNEYDMYGKDKAYRDANPNEYAKSSGSMLSQREQVADLINAEYGTSLTAGTVSEQDMIDVGNMQQIQKLADIARTEGEERWQAPLIRGVEQANLTGVYDGEEIPLNIPITRSDLGTLGRRGSGSIGNMAGEDITAGSAVDPKLNASLYYGDPSKSKFTEGDVLAAFDALDQKRHDEMSTGEKVWAEVKQIIPGLASGAGKGAVELADAAQELATYLPQVVYNQLTGSDLDIDFIDEGKKKAIIEGLDEITGYDRGADEKVLAMAMEEIKSTGLDVTSIGSIREVLGDPEKRGMLGAATLKVFLDPSLTASFISEIVGAGGALGAGTKIATKVGTKVAPKITEKAGSWLQSNRAEIGKRLDAVKADEALSATDRSSKIKALKDEYTLGKKVTDFMKGTSMTNADMAIRMSNDIEEYRKNNDGKSADVYKTIQMLGLNRLASNAEIGALKIEAGLGKKVVTDTVRGAIADTTKHLGKSIGVEAVQEGFDSIVEQINQKLGSKNYEGKTVGDILSEASAEIITGAVAGAASGGHLGAASKAPGAIAKGMTGLKNLSPDQEVALQSEDTKVTPRQAMERADAKLTEVDATIEAARNGNEKARAKIQNIATSLGSNKTLDEILGSDIDEASKVKKVQQIISTLAEDVTLDEDTKNRLKQVLMNNLKVKADEVEAVVANAEKEGKALGKLKRFGEVNKDVETGPRGFLTYYRNMEIANEEGDTAGYEAELAKLETFLDLQKTKRNRLRAAEQEIMASYEDAVSLTMIQEGVSKKEAERLVYKGLDSDQRAKRNRKKVEYGTESTNSFMLDPKTVVEKNTLAADPKEFRGGAYSFLSTLDEEVAAMEELVGIIDGPAVEGTKEPTTKNEFSKEIDKIVAEATSIDDAVAMVDTLPDISKMSAENRQELANGVRKRVESRIATKGNDEAQSPDEIPDIDVLEGNVEVEPDTGNTIEPEFEVLNDFEPDYTDMEVEAETGFEVPDGTDLITPNVEPTIEPDIDTNVEPDLAESVKPVAVGNKVKILKEMGSRRAKVISQIEEKEAKGEDTTDLEVMLAKYDKWLEDKRKAGTMIDDNIDRAMKIRYGDSAVSIGALYKTKLTPLNMEAVGADEAVKLVGNTLVEADMTKAGKVNQVDAQSDPGRVFVYNPDGSINANTALALYRAMNEYVVDNLGELSTQVEEEMIQKMIPIYNDSLYKTNPDNAVAISEHFKYGGKMTKFEAEGIGENVVKDLGISEVKDITDIQALKASFGAMAIAMGESMGYLENHPIVTDKQPVPIVRGKRGAFDKVALARNAVKKYEGYDAPDKVKNTYRKSGVVPGGKTKMHNQPYADTTGLQNELKKKLESMEYEVNSGIDVLIEMFGDDKEGLKKAIGKEVLNYKTVDGKQLINEALSFDKVDAIEARNREIDSIVDEFYEMLEDTKDGKSYKNLWFNWFVAKNGRTNLASVTVNPQSDKKIARWLVTALSAKTNVTVTEVMDASSEKGVGFLYAVVQAFDGVLPEGHRVEIDKNSQEDVIAAGKAIFELGSDKMMEAVKDNKPEHLGHALLAISNMRKLETAKNDSFESDMVLETDGLTNGLAFRFVQFAKNAVMKLLSKVGVLLPDSEYYDADTMAEVKGGKYGEFKDIYETVAGALGGSVKLGPEMQKIADALGDVAMKYVVDGSLKGAEREEAQKKLDKELRGLAKDPVMVTGYSAGEASTKRSMVKIQIGKLVDAIVEGKVEKDRLDVLLEDTGVKSGQIIGLLQANSVMSKELKGFRAKLEKFYEAYYADPMYEALMAVIEPLKEVGDDVTTAYSYMYDVMVEAYKAELKAAVAKKGGNTLLSESERVEVVRSVLKKVGPNVRNSESVGDHDTVVALSRRLKDVVEEMNDAGLRSADNRATVTVKLKEKNKTIRMILRLFGSPGAAGSVLQTHTEDNHTIARTMKDGDEYTQVFDAQILGIGQLSRVKSYNEEFYKLNKEFSMMDAVIEAYDRSMEYAKKNGLDVKVGKKSSDEFLDVLNGHKREIDANRTVIFGGDAKIGQMVGPNGLMHEVDSKGEAARIEVMKKALEAELREVARGSSEMTKMIKNVCK